MSEQRRRTHETRGSRTTNLAGLADQARQRRDVHGFNPAAPSFTPAQPTYSGDSGLAQFESDFTFSHQPVPARRSNTLALGSAGGETDDLLGGIYGSPRAPSSKGFVKEDEDKHWGEIKSDIDEFGQAGQQTERGVGYQSGLPASSSVRPLQSGIETDAFAGMGGVGGDEGDYKYLLHRSDTLPRDYQSSSIAAIGSDRPPLSSPYSHQVAIDDSSLRSPDQEVLGASSLTAGEHLSTAYSDALRRNMPRKRSSIANNGPAVPGTTSSVHEVQGTLNSAPPDTRWRDALLSDPPVTPVSQEEGIATMTSDHGRLGLETSSSSSAVSAPVDLFNMTDEQISQHFARR